MTFYMIYNSDGPIPQTLRATEREAWEAYSGELSTEETIAKLKDWGLTCRRVEVAEQGDLLLRRERWGWGDATTNSI